MTERRLNAEVEEREEEREKRVVNLGQSQWSFIRVLWALNRLMWHRIDEERDDKSFMGVERVS